MTSEPHFVRVLQIDYRERDEHHCMGLKQSIRFCKHGNTAETCRCRSDFATCLARQAQ
jgi:hypothetical protein